MVAASYITSNKKEFYVKQCTKYPHLYLIWFGLQCIWLCLLYSLQHLCSSFYMSLCGARSESVFRAEWETPTPKVSAFSSAYIYQWLMTAPLQWQTRQQQKHQKDWQKDQEKLQKGKEGTKGNMLYKWAAAGTRAGVDCIGEFGKGRGAEDRRVWGRKREHQKKRKSHERGTAGLDQD